MNIIVDAFGGDNAPLEVIKGCKIAEENLGTNIILTGDEEIIKKTAGENDIDISRMDIIHADGVFDIHDKPTTILKSGKNTSLAVGLKALSEGKGNAFLSAGSTGALVAGATFIVKRIKGIKRAALAPVLPTEKGRLMLIDGGANIDCTSDMLVQFAIMASAYMEKVKGIKKPRVGLINVGAEDTKGRELELEAYKLLSEAPVNFCGNLEAREMPKGNFDVAVTDGFTGNVALKLYEGMGAFIGNKMKDIFSGGIKSKLSALMVLGKIKALRKQMDYTEEGGAVLMGVSKPVIKAHGSSDAKAFYNAIRQAKACVDGGVIEAIEKSI
ncbi:MAG: phosphate acyltransferase PlsX [Oscillospiraceae bacterium]|jgi:glycerol-3-phosphate acyltransferase PlsX|nr:phosphate acyltransferase PlsX [Oscillospiraceae bacterium]